MATNVTTKNSVTQRESLGVPSTKWNERSHSTIETNLSVNSALPAERNMGERMRTFQASPDRKMRDSTEWDKQIDERDWTGQVVRGIDIYERDSRQVNKNSEEKREGDTYFDADSSRETEWTKNIHNDEQRSNVRDKNFSPERNLHNQNHLNPERKSPILKRYQTDRSPELIQWKRPRMRSPVQAITHGDKDVIIMGSSPDKNSRGYQTPEEKNISQKKQAPEKERDAPSNIRIHYVGQGNRHDDPRDKQRYTDLPMPRVSDIQPGREYDSACESQRYRYSESVLDRDTESVLDRGSQYYSGRTYSQNMDDTVSLQNGKEYMKEDIEWRQVPQRSTPVVLQSCLKKTVMPSAEAQSSHEKEVMPTVGAQSSCEEKVNPREEEVNPREEEVMSTPVVQSSQNKAVNQSFETDELKRKKITRSIDLIKSALAMFNPDNNADSELGLQISNCLTEALLNYRVVALAKTGRVERDLSQQLYELREKNEQLLHESDSNSSARQSKLASSSPIMHAALCEVRKLSSALTETGEVTLMKQVLGILNVVNEQLYGLLTEGQDL